MQDPREQIIQVTLALDAAGMVPNKSGNVSCRVAEAFAITPAGIPYRELRPDDILTLPVAGEPRHWRSGRRPNGACMQPFIAPDPTSQRSCTRTVLAPLRSPAPGAASQLFIT